MSTKQYIGTKLIQAEPAVRYQGKVYNLGDTLPVAALLDKEVEQGYRVVYPDGYVSWSPREAFEEAYRETIGMNFGLAVEAMKKGLRIARWAWYQQSNETYVFLASEVECRTNADISEFTGLEEGVRVSDMLVFRTEKATLLPGWLPSVEDILEDDWYIVDQFDSDNERTKLPF